LIYNLVQADHNGNKDAHKTTPATFPFHPASLAAAFNLRPSPTTLSLPTHFTPTMAQAAQAAQAQAAQQLAVTSAASSAVLSAAGTALNLSSSSRPTSAGVDSESANTENYNSRTRSPSTASRESYKYETDRHSSASPSKEGKSNRFIQTVYMRGPVISRSCISRP
jgi:uncharacterized protein YfiM (DUF2279 family)